MGRKHSIGRNLWRLVSLVAALAIQLHQGSSYWGYLLPQMMLLWLLCCLSDTKQGLSVAWVWLAGLLMDLQNGTLLGSHILFYLIIYYVLSMRHVAYYYLSILPHWLLVLLLVVLLAVGQTIFQVGRLDLSIIFSSVLHGAVTCCWWQAVMWYRGRRQSVMVNIKASAV